MRRDQRDRFEPVLFPTPSASDLDPSSAVQPDERGSVVCAGRAERVERLQFFNSGYVKAVAPGGIGGVLDSRGRHADLVLSQLGMERREEMSERGIAGQEHREEEFDYHYV
jgi:hypothetical protein